MASGFNILHKQVPFHDKTRVLDDIGMLTCPQMIVCTFRTLAKRSLGHQRLLRSYFLLSSSQSSSITTWPLRQTSPAGCWCCCCGDCCSGGGCGTCCGGCGGEGGDGHMCHSSNTATTVVNRKVLASTILAYIRARWFQQRTFGQGWQKDYAEHRC